MNFVPMRVARKKLGMSTHAILKLVHDGKIDYIKISPRIMRYDIEGFIEKNLNKGIEKS